MERKPIQVDDKTHEIFRLEAIRQTFKTGEAVSMGDVLTSIATKINKKHKHLRE